jgi:hypothetical protein
MFKRYLSPFLLPYLFISDKHNDPEFTAACLLTYRYNYHSGCFTVAFTFFFFFFFKYVYLIYKYNTEN